MRDVLTICREHGQAPSWWDEQDTETQALLLEALIKRTPKAKARR